MEDKEKALRQALVLAKQRSKQSLNPVYVMQNKTNQTIFLVQVELDRIHYLTIGYTTTYIALDGNLYTKEE